MTAGVFITGTDTGVGKTTVACALIHALASRGVDAMPMKPVAAGAVVHEGGWANADSTALLREPMAPHIAAEREKRRITLEPVRAAFQRLAKDAEFIVVEGVGGFLVPLDDELDTVDLARALGLPVLLVVGLRLGCLNHALLAAQAIAAARLQFAVWIANAVDPEMAVPDENVAALERRLAAPLLGPLPFAAPPDPAALASRIDVGPLLRERRA